MPRPFRLALIAVGLLATRPLSAQKKSAPAFGPGIDSLVAAMMAEWHVPGLALGIHKDGQPFYLKGYGYRDVEAKLPVTPRTLMAIGSNSKSFTVVLMGLLVDQKKLAWDTPVRTYLPDFQLYDEYASRKMTPRDLVTHRSGLPAHNLLWYGRKFARPELYQRLRYLEPNVSFREKWQYQNLMFMTAGYLVEQITGRRWDDLIREQIFTPLGMTRSLPGYPGFEQSDDFSRPYAWHNGATVRVPVRAIDQVGPAGSIYSSVEDMLKYIDFRSSHGDGAAAVRLSKAVEDEAQSPQSSMPGPGDPDGFDLGSYGLGLTVESFHGHRVIGHGGGIDGFISSMSWLPDQKIGVMILSNLGNDNPVTEMVRRAVYDRMLGIKPIDYLAKQRAADREDKQRADSTRQAFEATRKPGTKPSHDLAAYVGSFEHPGYGRLVVRPHGDGGLEIVLDDLVAPLKHFHYDSFEIGEAGSIVPLGRLARFEANAKGEVDRVLVGLEPDVAPIVFLRK